MNANAPSNWSFHPSKILELLAVLNAAARSNVNRLRRTSPSQVTRPATVTRSVDPRDGYATYLQEFLKALEVALPPRPKGHHAITYNTYGDDGRLGLHVHVGQENRTFFLTDYDLTRPIDQLVAEVVLLSQR